MHALDIIIRRNAEAAGREAAHADNDANDRLASEIIARASAVENNENWTDFARAYLDGRKEG